MPETEYCSQQPMCNHIDMEIVARCLADMCAISAAVPMLASELKTE